MEDCMEGMRKFPSKYFDLAIVDPEQGRRQHGGKKRAGLATKKDCQRKYYVKAGNHYAKKRWDFAPAPPEYFQELFRVSKRQIIWGCNYYQDNFGPGRIIWDKINDGSDQSNAEIAYNSMTDKVEIFRFMWRGMMQGKSMTEGAIHQGNKRMNEKRIHPTQKPLALYQYCLANYAKLGDKILDTHCGSQSSRIVAYKMGFDFWGYENDPDYYHTGSARFIDEVMLPLFDNFEKKTI